MYPGGFVKYTYAQFPNSQEFALDGGVIFDTLAKYNEFSGDGVFISAHKCSICVWLLKSKRFACEMGLFQKVVTHNLCQNTNFENGGTTIQVSILHVLLNILSISLLPMVHDTSVNFEMQKE